MFQFPALALLLSAWTSFTRVAPFGYVRIKSCLQIPAPFRSLPRPSSPPEAKASSVRPCNFSRYEFLFVSFNFVNCSPSKTFLFYTDYLLNFTSLSLSVFQWTTVFSQTGCKYTHFFLLSKFFSQKNAKFLLRNPKKELVEPIFMAQQAAVSKNYINLAADYGHVWS